MTTQEAAEPPAPDLRDTGARIDALIDALGTGGLGGPSRARERAEELVRVVTELYGAGLERLLEIVYDSGRLDEELLGLLARDELVSSLLLVHGLHPHDVRTRVEQALDDVRPYLGSHGGDVELVGITDEGTVRLRLLGSCDGCPSSSVTLELAVQDAIEAAAPEVTAIEVEAAPEQHPGLIPVDTLRSRLDARPEAAGSDWHPVPEADGLADGAAATVTVQQERLHLSRVGTDVFAFRDRCPRCSAGLGGAPPERRMGGAIGDALLRCPGCGAHFEVRRAGSCVEDASLHLAPLPVLHEQGRVTVAVPAKVPV